MKRTGIMLGILGVVLVTAAWYMLVMKPINETITDKQAQLQQAQDQELTFRTALARLQKIQDAELSYISAIGTLDAQIPPKPEMPALIDDLACLADPRTPLLDCPADPRTTGVEWLGSTYGAPTPSEQGDYYEIPISLRIRGQFFQVLGYLYGIADLPRLVRIDGVSVTPEQQDGYTILNLTISAKAFTTSPLTVPVTDTTAPVSDETTTTTQPETTTTTTEADAGSTTTTSSTTTTTTGGG